jgi:hypothetical protein
LEEQVPVSQEGGAYTNAVTVADNVSGLRLSYLSWENDKQEWLERWDPAERKTLPRAVRLNFKDEEAREVEWIFPIMLSVMTP